MFSGIIQAKAPIYKIQNLTNFQLYTIKMPIHLMLNLKVGCSISNNGCCLTVSSIKANLISFNLIKETLKLTNMNTLKIGDFVNIERSLSLCSEIGGHLMTGHIDCTGEIKKIISLKNNRIIWFEIKKRTLKKYIFRKCSIGVEGVSLTVSKILNNYVRICLIPDTLKRTTLSMKKKGDIVNIEIDMITKSISNNIKNILSPFLKNIKY